MSNEVLHEHGLHAVGLKLFTYSTDAEYCSKTWSHHKSTFLSLICKHCIHSYSSMQNAKLGMLMYGMTLDYLKHGKLLPSSSSWGT